ncbi:hypothetical protein [Streptomyces sp. URMC 123]|uniref:hypothetical protein n=1 Tax=Streptomyces sp. URMC 123 TaxID=3423403 RepID=UPI003F19CEEE
MSTGVARRRRTLGITAALATAAVALIGPGAAPAAAAPTGCPGHLARTLDLPNGQVRVYRSHTMRCAITYTRTPGVRTTMSVSIQARGGRPQVDSGRYTHHAGPVRASAGNRCVLVRGRVGDHVADSGWTLC